MSYNISSWKTLTIHQLIIPLRAFVEHLDNPKFAYTAGGNLSTSIGEGELTGKAITDPETGELAAITADEIMLYGGGSGSFYYPAFLKALKQSKGILTAFITWEGGDSFTALDVNDGNVTEHGVNPEDTIIPLMPILSCLSKWRKQADDLKKEMPGYYAQPIYGLLVQVQTQIQTYEQCIADLDAALEERKEV